MAPRRRHKKRGATKHAPLEDRERYMAEETQPATAKKSEQPQCQKPLGHICRGCPGWRAMRQAAKPGGPWEGLAIHCPASRLTLKPAGQGR